jgi:hypothetical protein
MKGKDYIMNKNRYEKITAEEAVERISKNPKWKQPHTAKTKDGKAYMAIDLGMTEREFLEELVIVCKSTLKSLRHESIVPHLFKDVNNGFQSDPRVFTAELLVIEHDYEKMKNKLEEIVNVVGEFYEQNDKSNGVKQ